MPCAPGRVKQCSGFTLLGLGLVGALAGFVVLTVLESMIANGIRDAVVVDSPSSPNFPLWTTPGPDSPPVYVRANLWHMTNLPAVLAGSTPEYVERGPYVYRKLNFKSEVEFSSDHEEVTYLDCPQYVFQPEMSVGDPWKDTVTNINPAYMAVLQATHAEFLIPAAGPGPTLRVVMEYLKGPFLHLIEMAYQAPVLDRKYVAMRKLVPDEGKFCETWANALKPPSKEWEHFVVSAGQQTGSGISATACHKLFAGTQDDSLTNRKETSWKRWSNAAMGSAQDRKLICQTIGLTDDQLQRVIDWLHLDFHPAVGHAQMIKAEWFVKNHVTQWTDIAFLQFGSGQALKEHDVRSAVELLPNAPFSVAPEYGVWCRSNCPVKHKIEHWKLRKLMEGDFGIYDPNNFIAYFRTTADRKEMMRKWGLEYVDALTLDYYLAKFLLLDVVPDLVTDRMTSGGSMFVTRTVDEVLFSAVDPLVSFLLGEQLGHVGLFTNMTDIELCRRKSHTYTLRTGHSNINDVSRIVAWDGKRELDMWRKPIPVTGNSIDGWHPSLQTGEPLSVFLAGIARAGVLEQHGEMEVEGISLHKYKVGPGVFGVDPLYYQPFEGLANMTGSYRSPVYISRPHMMDVPKYQQRVIGMKPDINKHEIFIAVEPITGRMMRGAKRVQVNVFVSDPNNYVFNLYNARVYIDAMYPVMWFDEGGGITPALAEQFRNTVYVAIGAEPFVVLGGIVWGLALAVPGFLLIRRGQRDAAVARGDLDPTDADAAAAPHKYYQALLSSDIDAASTMALRPDAPGPNVGRGFSAAGAASSAGRRRRGSNHSVRKMWSRGASVRSTDGVSTGVASGGSSDGRGGGGSSGSARADDMTSIGLVSASPRTHDTMGMSDMRSDRAAIVSHSTVSDLDSAAMISSGFSMRTGPAGRGSDSGSGGSGRRRNAAASALQPRIGSSVGSGSVRRKAKQSKSKSKSRNGSKRSGSFRRKLQPEA